MTHRLRRILLALSCALLISAAAGSLYLTTTYARTAVGVWSDLEPADILDFRPDWHIQRPVFHHFCFGYCPEGGL
jgi:hypothetical protein